MKTIIEKINVYEYDELGEAAKEKVRNWLLRDEIRAELLHENILYQLNEGFKSDFLQVQFDLNCCQGDGVNIYGNVNATNIFHAVDNIPQLDKYKGYFTGKEIKTILHYSTQCNNIEIPKNHRYCYCMANRIDFAYDWLNELTYNNYNNINAHYIYKFEEFTKDVFATLCKYYEELGYKYLYEIDEEEVLEICDSNKYYFTKEGNLYE